MTPPEILVVQNAEWEGPGLIASHAIAAGVHLSMVKLFAPSRKSIPLEKIEKGAYAAVVSLGSPSTAYLAETNPHHDELVEFFKVVRKRRVPSFNICYSMQLFCAVHGGKVIKNPAGKEVGFLPVFPTDAGSSDPVLGNVGRHVTLQWHGDIVRELPPGAVHLASSKKTTHQMAVLDGIHYMVQGDEQAATPEMVRSWLKHDGKWVTEGTGIKKQDLILDVVENEPYFRNTHLRLFGNFLSLAIQAPSQSV